MKATSSKASNSSSHPRKNKNKFKRRKRKTRSQTKTRTTHSTPSHSAEIVGGNQDLLSIIFSKIRKKKYVIRCKIICKNWYKVITGRQFAIKLPPPSDLIIRRYTPHSRPSLFPTIKYLTVPLDNWGPHPPTTHQPFLHFLESNHLH